jgi:hypothetical protein
MNKVVIEIKGYGDLNKAKKVLLTDGAKTESFEYKRIPIFGIYSHSLAELNMTGKDTSFIQPRYSMISIARKVLALGIASRRMFKGLFNGFSLSTEIDIDCFSTPPYLILNDETIYIARAVGRSGLKISNYNAALEYSIRRRQVDSQLFLLDSIIIPSVHQEKEFNSIIKTIELNTDQEAANDLLQKLPFWHGLRTYFSLFFDSSLAFQSQNVFQILSPAVQTHGAIQKIQFPEPFLDYCSESRNVDELPIFFEVKFKNVKLTHGSNIIKDRFLISDDSSLAFVNFKTAMWPALKWGHTNTSLISTPYIEDTELSISTGNFIPYNSNWAHFIEDIAPRAALINAHSSSSNTFYTQTSDKLQLEFFHLLNIESIRNLNLFETLFFEELTFVFHINHRNRLVYGDENLEVMCADVPIMKRIREQFFTQVDQSLEQNLKIFVYRDSRLFRRLVNQKRVMKYLLSQGYVAIDVSSIDLENRIQLYSSCSHIVYEYGAGGVNNYFARDGVNVVELRHPGNLDSVEQLGYIAVSNSNWVSIAGRKANIFQRLIFGTDSWTIPMHELKEISNN